MQHTIEDLHVGLRACSRSKIRSQLCALLNTCWHVLLTPSVPQDILSQDFSLQGLPQSQLHRLCSCCQCHLQHLLPVPLQHSRCAASCQLHIRDQTAPALSCANAEAYRRADSSLTSVFAGVCAS